MGDDPHEYGYTYFEVFFGCHEPPQPLFRPHELAVGFWQGQRRRRTPAAPDRAGE